MIDLDIADDIAVITLNSPEKLNALDDTDIEALGRVIGAAADARVRALVLRGEGRAFCAGRDISRVDTATDDVVGFLEARFTPLMRRLSAFPAPTFAAAQGATLGVGLGLLIATDVVYVSDDAKIGSPFANLGATLDSGGHALFFERLGAHKTLDLIYTGRLMSGEEAVASGLFSRAFSADALWPATLAAAAQAAAGATAAFHASKELVRQLRDERLGFWASLSHESRAQARLASTADYAEGFAAFQAKRPPHFTGA
jgi:2-(1,2-epoxy-1,2-dihydrophenyl)acetyl-CoA isomerase